MTFQQLSQYLQQLEETSSRNQITEILADLLSNAEAQEIDKVVYLLLGQLAPSYRSILLNFADKMMEESLSVAYNKNKDEIHRMYKEKGDLGQLAFELNEKKSSNLSVKDVYERLVTVAKYQGEGSQEEKINSMAKLLLDIDRDSSKFVARIPTGKLRLGFSEKTIIDALSWMERKDKSGRSLLERAYFVLPDAGKLAKEVKNQGIERTSQNIKPEVGVPVQPMLAQRLKSPVEMVKKMGRVAVEPKLDGLRLLIHLSKGKEGFVKAFTRNLNEVGWMFPELQKVGEQMDATNIILDVEAIGMDEERKQLADFQTTMQRRRKHEVGNFSSKIPITFYAFDVLLIDDQSLMDESYESRRSKLEKVVKKGNLVQIVDNHVTTDPDEIARLQKHYVEEGLEGILVKKVSSEYIPGRTGWRWVKMKEAELSSGKLSDTVDAIIMGYTMGRGKRTEFGIGQFLAGVLDGDVVKTVTKVGTGLSDDDFRELSKRLKKLQVKEKPKEYDVHRDLFPDYWVRPDVVVELAADDLTKSPKHTAGYALRFPRLIKFRDDKSPKEATTSKEVTKLYKLQFPSRK